MSAAVVSTMMTNTRIDRRKQKSLALQSATKLTAEKVGLLMGGSVSVKDTTQDNVQGASA